MSYAKTLEAAGAEVIDFLELGSYQGSWGAIVNYKGTKALVTGSYGSCSGCDAFLAEFDYDDEPSENNGVYTIGFGNPVSKTTYNKAVKTYKKKMSDFGASYLKTLMDKADIKNRLKGFKEGDSFDDEEKELYTWALKFFE